MSRHPRHGCHPRSLLQLFPGRRSCASQKHEAGATHQAHRKRTHDAERYGGAWEKHCPNHVEINDPCYVRYRHALDQVADDLRTFSTILAVRGRDDPAVILLTDHLMVCFEGWSEQKNVWQLDGCTEMAWWGRDLGRGVATPAWHLEAH